MKTKTNYAELEQQLRSRKVELLERFAVERSNLHEQVLTSPGDAADASTIDLSAAYFTRLSNQHRDEILEVQHALKRMHLGSYGVCEQCDEEIEVKRLRHLPYARLCIDCQKRNERNHPPLFQDPRSFRGDDFEKEDCYKRSFLAS